MERINSGIIGLDELIEGGFVKGSSILIVGAPGAGKTIFGLQFLLAGLKNGENGIYFTLEERKEDLLKDVERFGWNKIFEDYEKKGKFTIVHILPTSIEKIKDEIMKNCNLFNPQRVVIDNITLIKLSWEEEKDSIGKKRKMLFDLISFFKLLA